MKSNAEKLTRIDSSLRGYRRSALFLMILLSGGSLLFPRIPILLVGSILGLLASRLKIVPFSRTVWIWGILLLILVISLIRPGGVDFSSLSIRFANFLGGLVLLNTYLCAPTGCLEKDLSWLLRLMAIQAIGTVFLASIAESLFNTILIADASEKTLLFIFNYHESFQGVFLKRPDGFFFEPGVFQMYLNIFLYLSLIVYRRTSDSILALFAVFSTQSTTGIIIALFIVFVEIVRRMGSVGIRQKMKIGVLIFFVLPPIGYTSYLNVMEKISGQARGSSFAREYDLYTGLNVIAQYPILGIGFSHARYLDVSQRNPFADSQISTEAMEDRPTTNGLIYLYYSLGVPIGTIMLLGLLRQKLLQHRLISTVVFILSLFGEAIVFTPFILMFIFSALLIFPKNGDQSLRLLQ